MKKIMAAIAAIVWLLAVSGTSAAELPHHGLQVESEDGESCLSCHDGVVGPDIEPCVTRCASAPGASHPVGRPYPPPGKEGKYRPLAEVVKAGVRFHEGKLSCLSCHDLAKGSRYHLLVEDVESRLCRLCHIR